MSGYLKSLACLVCVLSLAGGVQGQTWTGAGADQFWSTPENWSTNLVPLATQNVTNDLVPGPVIANEGAVGNIVYAGFAGTGEVTVDGGTLDCMLFECARRAGSEGTLHMKNGTLTCDRLHIGRAGTGRVNLNGGTIYTLSFEGLGSGATAVGTLDVTAGTLIVEGNAIDTVQGYIDSNNPNTMIYAYQGRDLASHGQFFLVYDELKNETRLTAIHNLVPNPIDGGITQPGEVELSWTLPDPTVPGTPVGVDVYFTEDFQALYEFTDPEAMLIVNRGQNVNSVVVQTEIKKRYYWAVDVDVNGDGQITPDEYGPIFSFLADNAPPEVAAGPDIDTHLIDGSRTGPLEGTVADDGESYTVTWSVVEQPSDADPTLASAVIADPASLQTTITVSAVGTYVLKLEAFDGEYTGEDEMVITVHPDDWPK